jgi:hypothetical protein
MAFSSGTFSRLYSWATDLASGAPNHFITASRVDAELNGMATGLTTCLLKDGSQTVTANIPMATYRFTGLGAGSARTDSASMVDVQNAGSRHATSGGTNTVTLALSPASTAYAAGQAYNFKAGGTNTGAVTLNVNSLGAKAVQKNLAALVAGDITQNDIVEVVYDGTQFQMVSPARTPVLTANGIAGASVAIATATSRGSVEFATDAETITGTSTVLAVTPANVEAKVASATAKGVVELATNAEVITGTDTTRAITAGGLHAALAGLTDTTITASDTIVFADATDSSALKEDTVQGILDLASGGFEFVAKTAIAAATNLDVTSLGTGYDYLFMINSGVPATDGVNLQIQVSQGASFLTGSTDYRYAATSAAHILIAGDVGHVTQVEGVSLQIWFPEPNAGSLVKRLWVKGSHSNNNATSNENPYDGQGKLTSSSPTNACDGIRFFWSSGDWRNEGTIHVYRRKLS